MANPNSAGKNQSITGLIARRLCRIHHNQQQLLANLPKASASVIAVYTLRAQRISL